LKGRPDWIEQHRDQTAAEYAQHSAVALLLTLALVSGGATSSSAKPRQHKCNITFAVHPEGLVWTPSGLPFCGAVWTKRFSNFRRLVNKINRPDMLSYRQMLTAGSGNQA